MSYRLYHSPARAGRSIAVTTSGVIAVRVLASCLATLAIAVSTASPAAAHEGELEYVGRSGPFFVEVVDEVIEDAGLLYTITLRDLGTGLPADELQVSILARSGDTVVGPLNTNRFANAYQTFIPDDGTDTWTIMVEVGTERGILTAFEHQLRGVGSNGPSWWMSAIAALIIGAGTFGMTRAIDARRSRTPSSPGAEVDMPFAIDEAATIQSETTHGGREGSPTPE